MGLPAFNNQQEELDSLNQQIGTTGVTVPKQAIPTFNSQNQELDWLNRGPSLATQPTTEMVTPETVALPVPKPPTELPSRGVLSSILPAFGRGAGQFVKQLGQAGKALPIGGEQTIFEPMIKKGEQIMEQPSLLPSKESQGGLRRWLEQGLEQVGPSVGPQAAGAAVGFAAGGPPGAAAGWLIGGQVTPVIFGLSQYQEAIDTAKKQAIDEGKDPVQAEKDILPYAVASGLIEWGGEALANYMEAKLFGVGGAKTALTDPLKNTVKKILTPSLANTAKTMVKTFGVEAGTEALQGGFETYVEAKGGIKHEQTPMEAAMDAIGPTIVMTALFGLGAGHVSRTERKQLLNEIRDPESNNRLNATREIHQGLLDEADAVEKKDPETAQQYRQLADQWDSMTRDAINRKQPIELDQTITEATEAYKPTEEKKGVLPVEAPIQQAKPVEAPPVTPPIPEVTKPEIQGQVQPVAEAILPTPTPPPTPAPELISSEVAKTTGEIKPPKIEGLEYNGIQKNIPGEPDQYVFTDLKTKGTFYTTDLSKESLIANRDRIQKNFAETEQVKPQEVKPIEPPTKLPTVSIGESVNGITDKGKEVSGVVAEINGDGSILIGQKDGNMFEVKPENITVPGEEIKAVPPVEAKPAEQPTRDEVRLKDNTPKYESILKAIKEGKKVELRTQYKIIPLTKPEHIRIIKNGEVQIQEGSKWVYLTSPQINSLAFQSGMETANLRVGEQKPAAEDVTPAFLSQLKNRIDQILPRGTPFDFVQEIWVDTSEAKYQETIRQYKASGKWSDVPIEGHIRVEGQTRRFKTTGAGIVSMVEVATGLRNEREVTEGSYHESWHAIRPVLLSKTEQTILSKKYANEEDEASAFGKYAQNKEIPTQPTIKRIFAKIKGFFEAWGNYLDGQGFKSAEDIFGQAYENKLEGQKRNQRIDNLRRATGLPKGAMPITETAALKLTLPQGITNAKSENPDVEKRMEEAYGLDQTSHIEKFKGQVFKVLHSFTRHFEHLPSKRFGKVIDILRRFEQVPEFAKKEASDRLKEIVGGLNKAQLNIFSRSLILNDLVKDYENNLYDHNKSLPFGYRDIAEVQRDLTKFESIAKSNKSIQGALDKRQQIWDSLKTELIDKEILPEAVKADDRYFHHQVLQYMAIKNYYPGLLERRQYTGLSPKEVRLHRKGWQIAREGSALDFNTNYLESEFEVFSQAVAQIETIKTLDRIQGAEDISSELKDKAKQTGKTAKEWKEFIPEGYTTWQPKKGFNFYMANTITDKFLENMLSPDQFAEYEKTGKITIPGIGLAEVDEMSIRKALSVGQRKAEWAIPIELQKTMDAFRDFKDEGPLFRGAQALLTSWKQWILLNPLRVVKYNLNNLSGDADIALAYNPRIMTQYGYQAMRDLYAQVRGQAITGKLAEELREASKGGVVGSGISVHEIPDISKSGVFKILTGEKSNVFMKYWNTVKDYTNFRENILRLAAYRFFKDEIKKGSKVYGASKVAEVDAIKDPNEKAAKLARELIGDYGNISRAGQWIRSNLIPFYSWIEINAPRYVRLIQNLGHEGKRGQAVGFGALKAVKLGVKAGKLGVKMLLLYGLVILWNYTFFPDEEEELGRSAKSQLHLILGRRSDGTIRSLKFQGALSDALSWFGLEDFPQDFKEVMSGKVPWTKKLTEGAWAGPDRLFQGARPLEKAVGEVITGKALYPEMRKPRPIRDKVEHILKTINLDIPYKYVAGKPTRGIAQELEGMATYRTDPGEAAYYDIANKARDFLEEQGYEVPSFTPTEKSNILYYYKQAQKMGDQKAAQKYMEKYIEAGGNKQDLMKSIKKSHPMAMVPIPYRKMFMQTLDEEDRKSLEQAVGWWQSLYGG